MRISLILRAALIATLCLAGARQASAQQPRLTTTGSLASTGDAVTVSLVNVASVTVQLSGSWAGLAIFQVSADGGTTWVWTAAPVVDLGSGGPARQATINGLFMLQNPGYTAMRVFASAWDSGTATVTVTRGFGAAGASSAPPLAPALIGVGLPLPICNPVRTLFCRPKGF